MLWKKRLLIVAVTLVALLAAVGYLLVRTETYESQGSVRLNPIVTEAVVTSELGGVRTELGQEVVSSPDVLDAAAASIGDDATALADSIEVEFSEESSTGRMRIKAEAPTADGAQQRVQAVIDAYREYVDEQMAQTVSVLEERRSAAVSDATKYQSQVANDPTDSIAATNLTSALSRMSAASSQLDDITNAGSATAVLASVPMGAPTVPSAPVVLALAIVTGLIVGMGAALIRDQFDDRLRVDDDIEELTGVPGVGELSWDRNVARVRPPLPVAADTRTDLSEGLRTLRSTVQVLLPQHDGVVVITSVEPGDGKSFVSVNLALAWARAGREVILVGGDMRRPDLGRYFGEAADGQGLAEILEEAESDDALVDVDVASRLNATEYRRLRVLPAGAEPPDPADLLAHSRLGDVIERLRELADIVVIDSPPALGMSDAGLLAANAAGVVVVASVGRTDRERLIDTVASLRANEANVLGVVANRSRRKLPKSYSAYYSQAARR